MVFSPLHDFANSPAGSMFWFEKEKDAMMFKIANS